MLRLIYSFSDLDVEQLLLIYKEHNWNVQDFLSYLYDDFFRQQGAFYAVWVVDGKYKSAVRLEAYRDGLLLHSLETGPDDRRNGYGYDLLSNVLDYLRTTDYKRVYSHIGKSNRASLSLHRKTGFEIIADTATYIDGTVTQNSYTACICL